MAFLKTTLILGLVFLSLAETSKNELTFTITKTSKVEQLPSFLESSLFVVPVRSFQEFHPIYLGFNKTCLDLRKNQKFILTRLGTGFVETDLQRMANFFEVVSFCIHSLGDEMEDGGAE